MLRNCGKLGLASIALGLALIVAMLMPSSFWFVAIGLSLIAFGLFMLKKR